MKFNSKAKSEEDLQTAFIKRANKMRAARLRKGYSQSQMARLVGTTQPTYSRIESGYTRQPDEEILERVAQILEVPKKYLLEEEPSERSQPEVERIEAALSPKDIPTIIRDLKALLDDGVITEAQFEEKRKELLDRL